MNAFSNGLDAGRVTMIGHEWDREWNSTLSCVKYQKQIKTMPQAWEWREREALFGSHNNNNNNFYSCTIFPFLLALNLFANQVWVKYILSWTPKNVRFPNCVCLFRLYILYVSFNQKLGLFFPSGIVYLTLWRLKDGEKWNGMGLTVHG